MLQSKTNGAQLSDDGAADVQSRVQPACHHAIVRSVLVWETYRGRDQSLKLKLCTFRLIQMSYSVCLLKSAYPLQLLGPPATCYVIFQLFEARPTVVTCS